MDRKIDLTIIIPTSNRPHNLLNILKMKDSVQKVKEVIYVVNGNERIDEYRHFGRIIKEKVNNVRILYIKEKGRCRAKNFGSRISKSRYLLFIDDDIILPKNYFFILEHFKNRNDIGAVGGALSTKLSRLKVRKNLYKRKIIPGKVTSYGFVYGGYDLYRGEPIFTDSLSGSNMVIKRDIFSEVGGFDERYDIGIAYREETDLCLRIRKKGYKIIFDPNIVVVHKDPNELSIRRIKKWSRYYYINQTYFFVKNFYCNSVIRIVKFFFYEFFLSIVRMLNYKVPYFLIYYPRIFFWVLRWIKEIKEDEKLCIPLR